MGKHKKKVDAKLKARQQRFDNMKGSTKGFKRPGSRNLKKG